MWGCSPHSKEEVEVLECIQKKATELGKDLEHKERLGEFSLEKRRLGENFSLSSSP